jgi:DNA repair exonuclease SbcCD ATPase subunit
MAEQIKKVLTIEIDVESGEVNKLSGEVKKVADNTKKAEKGVASLAGGFKKVGTAMKAAGIGLVIALLATLKEVFSENQAVVDTFSTAMTGLKIAFNDFFKFVSGNLETVTGFFKKIFDDPLGSIKSLGEAIKDNIIERFNSLLDTLGYAGDALKKFFEGDFSGAIESAKQAGKELVDVYTGVNNSFDRTVDFVSEAASAIVDYTTETWKSADAITEQAKATKMLELEQQRLREQYDRDAENLRQIRDDETKSFEERIEANRRLGEVLNEQQIAEQETVKKRIANLQNLQKQLGFNQERYEEIYALQTELIAIEAQQAGFRSEQLTNENSLLREQADYEQSLIDARLEAERKASEEAIALAKKEAEEKKAAQEASFSVAASTLSALSALNDAFVKDDEASKLAAFKRQKALGIASAIISTSEAAINAFKSTVGIPVVGPVLAPIAAAAAIAAGVAQVQNIRKQEYNGGSSSAPSISPSGGTGALSQAPQFNTVGTSGFNQLAIA